MSFVPAVPGFSPVSYGQGYGDWQQYAGYGKDNPFGGGGGLGVLKPKQANGIAPPNQPFAAPTGEMEKPNYILPVAPLGSNPSAVFGAASQHQFGTPDTFLEQIKKDEHNY